MTVLAPALRRSSRPAAGSPPSARPPCRPTRSTPSPPRRAPRSPPPGCSTARRTSPLLGFLALTYVAWGAGLRRNLRRELGAARADRHEHQRALEGRARPRRAARLAPAHAAARGLRRLRRHRARQGGALLRGRVRRRARQRLRFLRRRDRLPRRREPRRRRLRVRARRPDARVPAPRARIVRRRLGPGRVPRRLLRRRRARRGRDDRVLHRRDPRDRAGRADPVLRHRADAAPRLPVRRPRVGDPPRRLPAAEPRRDPTAGWSATPAPTTGGRSCATRSSARACDAPTEAQLAEREELTRAKVTRLLEADAGDREPVAERYTTVVSAYCADSATADRATWEAYMRHIAGLVAPGRRLHHRRAAPLALLPRRRQALPERRRRRARPARGARARVRLRDRGPRGPRARAARLRGHRARYGQSTPTSVGSGSSADAEALVARRRRSRGRARAARRSCRRRGW